MINKILAEIRRQMNGAVSQTMRELGQRDTINFGVSLPTIKEIALRYAPNHELACQLSERKSREALIAALYIADARQLTEQQMRQWSLGWQNEEIARLSAMILFHQSPHAALVAGSWLNSTPLCHTAALYIIGKLAADIDNEIIDKVVQTTATDAATTYSLRELYYKRPEYRTKIKELANHNGELLWQLDSL